MPALHSSCILWAAPIPAAPSPHATPLNCSTGCLQLCCGRNCGLLIGTAHGQRRRKKVDLRLVHNLNREATQQVGRVG